MKTIAKKLRIKPNTTVWLSDPARLPLLAPMPDGVRETDTMAAASTAVLFADDAASVRKLLEEHTADLAKPAAFWVAYPKGNKADINRDTLWPIVADFDMRPNSQVAIDDRWSALRFRPNRDGEGRFTMDAKQAIPGRKDAGRAAGKPDHYAVFAKPTGPATFHMRSFATSYRALNDHQLDESAGAFGETTTSWYYLTGVDVAGSEGNERGAVVAFGDSITDGAVSTVDANHRYPDVLAERLVGAGHPMSVLNAGIATNQVLGTFPGGGASALDRFRHDALDQPGARSVIILEGINDIAISTLTIGEPVTAAQLIDGCPFRGGV
jgi:GDSL-like lipase/acylhydrolase family protein